MNNSIKVTNHELPDSIARLRAEGRRASSITVISTGGYRVTVQGSNLSLGEQPRGPETAQPTRAEPRRILDADELPALCARLKSQGRRIASLRHVGAGEFALTVVADYRAQRPGITSGSRQVLSRETYP